MIDSNNPSMVVKSTVKDDSRITILSINRPQKANAYNEAVLDVLQKEIRAAVEDFNTHVIVLTGKGNRSFCAGADLNELKTRRAEHGLDLKSRKIFDYLASSPKLTIAAVNGAAVGGGLELALGCDIRVCAPNAKFAFPEIDFALTPAAGGMRRIPAIIGKSRAKEMILFGRELNAQEALEWGLVSYVGEDFKEVALQHARRIASLDQLAVSLAKKVIDEDKENEQNVLESVVQALLYERKFNLHNSK